MLVQRCYQDQGLCGYWSREGISSYCLGIVSPPSCWRGESSVQGRRESLLRRGVALCLKASEELVYFCLTRPCLREMKNQPGAIVSLMYFLVSWQRNNAAEASVQTVPSSEDTSFTETDFKSLVNRYCQKTKRSHSYVEVKKDGPSHVPQWVYVKLCPFSWIFRHQHRTDVQQY